MFCEMWHHLHNLKNLKNTHGEVLLLVKLQAKRKSENMTCNIFDEKIVIKKTELQLHKNRFGELFYHYVTAVST